MKTLNLVIFILITITIIARCVIERRLAHIEETSTIVAFAAIVRIEILEEKLRI